MKVAYFSMEIGIDPDLPTYSGGLGILAGDTLKAAADGGLPMVGVTLLYRQGYFRQRLDAAGHQREEPVVWQPEEHLEQLDARPELRLEGRRVRLRIWRRWLQGSRGHKVPVYFLDAAVAENDARDRTLTDALYGGDAAYRLAQECVLGLGGIAALRALGQDDITTYHMNEGHSALLSLALAEEASPPPRRLPKERQDCVFTTHTPVPAGHDCFPAKLVERLLGQQRSGLLETTGMIRDGQLNMTLLAIHAAHFVNGVALRHGEVSRDMFPQRDIRAITNGVHAATWTSAPFRQLFDRRIPEWRSDNHQLRHAVGIPQAEIARAHAASKDQLLAAIAERTGERLDPKRLTIGFARRATEYKRAYLLFSDAHRLATESRRFGGLQVVMAGKAHPRDRQGKEIIHKIFTARRGLADRVPVVYLENYDMNLGSLLTSGVDVWLNTPERPLEASGTSGMKAALNGVPSLSILDGWWIEGAIEGVTGWSIGGDGRAVPDWQRDSIDLYDQLERRVMPTFYQRPEEFTRIRRACIAFNASFFNTQRMVGQYAQNAYGLAPRTASTTS